MQRGGGGEKYRAIRENTLKNERKKQEKGREIELRQTESERYETLTQ